MNGKRDCKNCIHKVPVFDEEEGIWRGADCDAWECNFVSRAEALKAYEARPQGDIRWTDKVFVKSNGDIIDFEGRVVGHINLEDVKGGAE